MSDPIDTEADIFDAATAPEPAPSAPAAAPAAVEAEVVNPPQTDPAVPVADDRGDLNVALRKERDETKRMREENSRLMQILERFQPPKPAEPEKEQPQVWDNPDDWVRAAIDPVTAQIHKTTEFYSRRMAEQQHGADKVQAAYDAMDQAINNGELNRDQVIGELRQSMDPFGDIMAWHQRHQALSEIGTDPNAYRERVRAELMAEMNGGARPAGDPPPASAPKPAAPPQIPSVNRAVGNAGATQSTSITEDDIFNAAPAFGKRKT